MQVSPDLFKWLKGHQVVAQGQPKQNGKVELDAETSSAFYNGFKVYELLDRLMGPYSTPLKQSMNPTARLFNWNIITERLHQIKIDLDTDIKQLIIGGDLEMIVEILKDIYSRFQKDQAMQHMKSPKKTVDVDTLNSAKPLSSCESIMEFILVALSQSMALKPKQAQQLLNNNFKLLTHVFVKGVKGAYQPLVQLLQESYNNMPRLLELCREEEPIIAYLVQMLKLSLFSKDGEVVHWGLRLIGKLAYDLASCDLLFHIFQWLRNGGMQNLIITLQRHQQLAEPLAICLGQIACYDFNQIFGVQKYFENLKLYLDFYGLILPYVVTDLFNYNLESDIQAALKLGEQQCTRDEKCCAIQFTLNAWLCYPSYFEQNLQLQQNTLQIIQRSAKDTSQILRQYSMVQAFKVLDGLALKKAPSAGLVFKKLISVMIESQNNEFILRQFSYIIKKYPSIPIDMLVEGLIKNQAVNVADCDIYEIISEHQNLKLSSAIQILELLVRIYTTNVIFQSSIFIAIQKIMKKFIEVAEFQDYMSKVGQNSLGLYINSIKAKRGNNPQINYHDDSVINQQRRAQIILMLQHLISLRCYTMNNLLKPLLVGAHLELQNIESRENKGIMILLSQLGDPYNIVEEVVRKDIQQQESQLFLEKKIEQMGGGSSNILQEQFMQQNKDMFSKEEDLVQSLLIEDKKDSALKKKTETKTKTKVRNYDFDEFQCIYEEGELAYRQQELQLIEFQTEEDVDRESMNVAIKHFNKTFKYLFNKYAISPQEAAKNRLRNLDMNKLTLRTSDIVKILQDYEVYNFSTYEEILTLIKEINNRYNYFGANNQSDLFTEKNTHISGTTGKSARMAMDLDTFSKFLVQYAMIIFGRPPKDLRKMPAGHVLHDFFKFFGQQARRKNENHLIFEDPDGVTTVADKVTIQKWNLQLLQHPNTEVPPETNLKKVKKEDITLVYQMRPVITNLPMSYLHCYEIINDLIQKRFKSNIVEPIFKVQLIYQVTPIMAKGVHKDMKIDPLLEKQEYLKSSLSLLPADKQELLNKSLDVSNYEDKIINKSMISRLVHDSELALQKELKDVKWRKRKEYLDKQYPKIQDFREQKESERQRKQAQEAEEILEEQANTKPKGAHFLEGKRKELRVYKSEVLPLKELKKEGVDIKGRTEKLKEELKKDSEDVKNNREKERNQPKLDKSKHKKQIEKAKLMAGHYEQVKKMKIEFNQKFANFYNDAGVQAQFKHFRSAGSQAFNHFLAHSNSLNRDGKLMELEGWMQFATTFNLHQIFSEEELHKIFTATLKQKNYIAQQEALAENRTHVDDTGLSYFEFEYLLLKVAILGQGYFNTIKSGKDPKVNYEQLLKFKGQQLQEKREKHKHQEKVSENMAKTSNVTVEAMLGYLDIPQNKDLFKGRLRGKKGDDVKEVTLPKKQSVDMKVIQQAHGLPPEPQVKPPVNWTQPGYHGTPTIVEKTKKFEEMIKQEQSKLKQKLEKNNQPIFLKKNHKSQVLLEKYGKKQ